MYKCTKWFTKKTHNTEKDKLMMSLGYVTLCDTPNNYE